MPENKDKFSTVSSCQHAFAERGVEMENSHSEIGRYHQKVLPWFGTHVKRYFRFTHQTILMNYMGISEGMGMLILHREWTGTDYLEPEDWMAA